MKKRLDSSGKLNVALVTYPYNLAVPTGLENFITEILAPLCNQLFLITGQLLKADGYNIHPIRLEYKFGEANSLPTRVWKLIAPQSGVTWNLLRISKKCDLVIFYCTAELFILPMLVSKLLLRKKVVIIHTGSLSISYGELYHNRLGGIGRLVPFTLRLLERATFRLADRIVVQSKEIVKIMRLERYQDKVSVAHYYFFDDGDFKVRKPLGDRQNMVGYIGHFAEFKGAVNFARAIPLILAQRDDVQFLMAGGKGAELCRVEKELKENGGLLKVILLGLTPREQVGTYLNELKLLVLPSYSEGIPKIVLEAMACGTPVLASAVGGVPDLIADEITGFLLKDNSPQSIAEGVIFALEHLKLGEISASAVHFIEKNWTFQAVSKKWVGVLRGNNNSFRA